MSALWTITAVALFSAAPTVGQNPTTPNDDATPPNIVVLFADDLGYGDLGCYGHPTIATPQLDRLATEGQRWTDFYVAAPVCTPSRAGLLTGRLPIRNGMCGNRRVLFPDSSGGLPDEEVTIAEALKPLGYATACIGKWHLGHLPEHLPTTQGFDSYFGIPYSNDMDKIPGAPPGMAAFLEPKTEYFNVPLLRNTETIERPADQYTITKRYTDEAVAFIQANRDKPFFCYVAYSLPHVPLFASEDFQGTSLRGLYGDVVEEIDFSVGRIVATLGELGIEGRTLVMFTSDNGPWITYDEQGGSAGLLRGGKGSTWEGGMREPTVFWWPGTIRPGVVRQMGATLDVLPTCVALAGGEMPDDRVLDGADLSPVLLDKGDSPRDTVFYYRTSRIFAVRHGRYKLHFTTQSGYGGDRAVQHDPPLLYDLQADPSEQYDVAADHPEVVAELRELVETHRNSFEPPRSQLNGRIPRPRQ